MIRIVVENIFFFMLPSVFYIAWVAFKEDEWSGLSEVIRKAPLLRLFAAGAALMLLTLVVLSSRSYNDPRDVYVPPAMDGGKIDPGHSIRVPEPQPSKP